MNINTEYTYKHNKMIGRHGWLRLTPAYSVKVVRQILDEHPEVKNVLDPFSGTGTTGLVSAEHGLHCDLLDINPFLVWFGRVKTLTYSSDQIVAVRERLRVVVTKTNEASGKTVWLPPIKNIGRWWSPSALDILGRLRQTILDTTDEDTAERNLMFVVFCRCLIGWSNAAFNHQSMSFKESDQVVLFEREYQEMIDEYVNVASGIIDSVTEPLPGSATIRLADSRTVPPPSNGHKYDAVITSPPYPNRMSYVRELRPYMYWLGFLTEAREAGELDWKAIGGTWGIATSWVATWRPNGTTVPHEGFDATIKRISERSDVLARYVHKYFDDTVHHIESVYPHITEGGRAYYIVGNSKFYDTMVDVEEIYASIMRQVGFTGVKVDILRKRNSKKELFEYIVSGVK